MTIPKKVKVGGITYKVVITENLESDVAGGITTDKSLIKILKGDAAFMQVTFFHELFHAINMEMREETVEFLAQAINQVIVDNPLIFTDTPKQIISKGGEHKHGK